LDSPKREPETSQFKLSHTLERRPMIKLVAFEELPYFALTPQDLAEGEELGH
jgi:hypothetical protein